ncbi:hypothetical protein DFH11DRAFT_1569564 [Phellopilus nigrolimitatus]|nr:hypothetical protein DFH11DRAFT_1569564 [Phellopilus nigrolimitatus]
MKGTCSGSKKILESSEASTTRPDDDSESDYDSLFDAEDEVAASSATKRNNNDLPSSERPAQRVAPQIPGLHFNPSILIPTDLASRVWDSCMQTYFHDGDVNQVMLFERARASKSIAPSADANIASDSTQNDPDSRRSAGFPAFLLELLSNLNVLLESSLPPEIHALLFPRDDESGQARQVILNHYRPGEGISPHVDLLKRYGDGIIGVSLHSGCVMRFVRTPAESSELARSEEPRGDGNASHVYTRAAEIKNDEPSDAREDSVSSHSLYLPARSIIVMSGEARYKWTHGISQLTRDLVESVHNASSEEIPREERVSITYRWLLPGADVVGN